MGETLITSWISKKVLDEIFSLFKGKLIKNNISVTSKITDLESSLSNHLKQVEIWASEISFKELSRPKSIDRTFIELDSYLTPKRKSFDNNNNKKYKLLQYIENNIDKNIIILGQPGAGKTTSIKKICQNLLHNESCFPNLSFPIVIRLKELTNNETLLKKLFFIFNFNLFLKNEKGDFIISTNNAYENKEYFQSEFYELLDELKLLLIIDGLDEIEEHKRNEIIKELQIIAFSFFKSRFILTCRTADYNYQIENSIETEICDLSESQIQNFVLFWLNDEIKSNNFLKKIEQSSFSDTILRPLNLAHLLAIFERENDIPEKPKSVYRKLINVILEEWDQQRQIVRKSKYANFQYDIKFEFLSNLSFELTTTYNTYIFTKSLLEQVYKDICTNYNLPISESRQVINEIESHNGLIIQSSYESYEFAHKSLQEYLCASYLCGLKKIPKRRTLINIPNELAICVAISSNHNEYFFDLILNDLKEYKFSPSFVLSFINRLIIEKVDFYQNPNIVIALLFILTKVDQESFSKKNEFKIEIFDKFFNEYKLFPIIEQIGQYYFIEVNNYVSHSGYEYSTLKRIKKEINEIELPIKLYLPIQWVKYL